MNEATTVSTSAADVVIHTDRLTKRFGHLAAVDEVSMAVREGTIFGFIGPSGCGKTTTVRLLLGIYEPSEGEVAVFGRPPREFSRHEKERIGYMPQLFVLYPDLSVLENLNFAASLYGVPLRRKERIQEILELVELSGHEKKLVRQISGGMQRRLSLAAALVHDPELLFLDEPTAGVDPVLRHKFWEHFQALADEGRTLFVTTQYVAEASYCDYVGVMVDGRLLMVETPIHLRQRALGGDIIRIHPAKLLTQSQLAALKSQPFVKDERVRISDDASVEIIVCDASAALPKAMDWFQSQGISIESANEYVPPFDEVFVRIVEQETPHAESRAL